MLSTALPHPSSLRVSIELAREKTPCAEEWDGARPRSGFRRLRRRLSLSWSVVSDLEREFAARACLRNPLTASSIADCAEVGQGSDAFRLFDGEAVFVGLVSLVGETDADCDGRLYGRGGFAGSSWLLGFDGFSRPVLLLDPFTSSLFDSVLRESGCAVLLGLSEDSDRCFCSVRGPARTSKLFSGCDNLCIIYGSNAFLCPDRMEDQSQSRVTAGIFHSEVCRSFSLFTERESLHTRTDAFGVRYSSYVAPAQSVSIQTGAILGTHQLNRPALINATNRCEKTRSSRFSSHGILAPSVDIPRRSNVVPTWNGKYR
jgi:hypothetical protein